MSHKEKALQYFADKFHCSQAVLAAFAEECGISEEQALKIGACFGAGMRKGEVCGACTGALIVLGLLYGQWHKGDMEERQRANIVNDLMMDRFKEENGSYMNGPEFKTNRKILMENLTGHSAFRTPAEEAKWKARQAEKREALKAAKAAETTEEVETV